MENSKETQIYDLWISTINPSSAHLESCTLFEGTGQSLLIQCDAHSLLFWIRESQQLIPWE